MDAQDRDEIIRKLREKHDLIRAVPDPLDDKSRWDNFLAGMRAGLGLAQQVVWLHGRIIPVIHEKET